MARQMLIQVWVTMDPELDTETTTNDVRESANLALREDIQRTFPYDVDDIEVEELPSMEGV